MIRFFKLLNAPCRDMAALISRAQDGRLSASERFAVRTHLLYCKACRRYRRQVELMRRALSELRAGDGAIEASPATQSAAASGMGPEVRERLNEALRQAGDHSHS